MSRRIVSKHRAFIEAFKITANLTKAAKAAGVDRSSHYEWLENVPGYQALFEAAIPMAIDVLQDEAIRRAHEGVLEPQYYQGKAIGARRVYSDSLLMFLLKAWSPRYRDQSSVELSGKDGGPIQTGITVTFVNPTE